MNRCNLTLFQDHEFSKRGSLSRQRHSRLFAGALDAETLLAFAAHLGPSKDSCCPDSRRSS